LERNDDANNILHNVRLDAIQSHYESISISTLHYMTYQKKKILKYILRNLTFWFNTFDVLDAWEVTWLELDSARMPVAWASECEFGGWVAVCRFPNCVRNYCVWDRWIIQLSLVSLKVILNMREHVSLKGIGGGVLKAF